MSDIDTLLLQLSDFDAEKRRDALRLLMERFPDRPPEKPIVNMHMHSFYSFNGEGWSPSRLVWEARSRGLHAMAVCDFDVLDALPEVFEASDALEVRAAVGFESRVFFGEYADVEINSPGEPGVFYFMGMGFVNVPPPDSPEGRVLTDMRDRARRRNEAVVARINDALGDLRLDYEQDVLPLTPAGNATERHIVRSYYEKSLALSGGNPDRAAAWWAERLSLPEADVRSLIRDPIAFQNLLRSKLIKKGGPGYVPPTKGTFPPLDDVIAMIRASGAIPMTAWLDGTSPGESDPDAQLDCLMAKGVEAVNIIPDRNWNLSDPDERARKIAELDRYVAAATKRNLPINVGTELNKPGQRFVDDFDAPPMRRHAEVFLAGARVVVGHTRLLRYAGVSYIGPEAAADFPDRADRNRAFAAVGALPPPSAERHARLLEMENSKAYALLMDAARRGTW